MVASDYARAPGLLPIGYQLQCRPLIGWLPQQPSLIGKFEHLEKCGVWIGGSVARCALIGWLVGSRPVIGPRGTAAGRAGHVKGLV